MSGLTISSASEGWRLEHTYASLPDLFHVKAGPVPVKAPAYALFNSALATELGLNAEELVQPRHAALFAGNVLPEGCAPLAQAYAGHQFGRFTTLGDGRAILLGEQITPGGERFDIQLKGAGLTPFSRGGDGRAALGPMLREYIISESMHALGIPTTRSLAVVTTGEPVFRPQALPGAVLTRVAASHIRVGTFEWASARGDRPAMEALADHTLRRHYQELAGQKNPWLPFLKAVIGRQAALIAQWMLTGFIHGVMNTDNMSIAGETIDYGPCAFMDRYDLPTVFSSIDHHGRYAWQNQPSIAQWNLARFAETLLPLLHPHEPEALRLAHAAIQGFTPLYQEHWLAGMGQKLGLFTREEGDATLILDLLSLMQEHGMDFTNTFRRLTDGIFESTCPATSPSIPAWQQQWTSRLGRQPQSIADAQELMRCHNPAFIPRNHKVEEALTAAVEQGDYRPLHRLLTILAHPWDHTVDLPEYQNPPGPGAHSYQTFCGT